MLLKSVRTIAFLLFLGVVTLSGCQKPGELGPFKYAGAMQIVDAKHCAKVSLARPFMLVLQRDDDFMKSLKNCTIQAKLPSAVVSGAVGALKNLKVAFFDVNKKKYVPKNLSGNFELLAANGNITWVDGQATPHIHVTLGDNGYNAKGGHLISAEVAAVAEIRITPLQTKATRSQNDELGLKTIDVNK